MSGAPGRTRICNPRIRSPTLYPFELLGRDGDILIERYISVKLGRVFFDWRYVVDEHQRHDLAVALMFAGVKITFVPGGYRCISSTPRVCSGFSQPGDLWRHSTPCLS
jgi:hypothetical protein